MQTALHLTATVLPGKRIEISAPELPENGTVDLVIYLPDKTGSGEPTSDKRYPELLNAEYNMLVQAQWQRALTPEEKTRLEEIRAQINAIDAASGADALWQRQMAQIREQLAEIRREVEALPDAS
ncbi:MAG TPA: hypothetical protein VKU00_12235 [Chthonomonadaceae bacterium]|nr:hypothetical protein [Chthonomonadaceae bacterium]